MCVILNPAISEREPFGKGDTNPAWLQTRRKLYNFGLMRLGNPEI
jgi:hypothetical protein